MLMSKLEAGLAGVEFDSPHKGPRGACYAVYSECDMDDFHAVEKLKTTGVTWAQLQVQVDKLLGVTDPISTKKFTYHWRGLCTCWNGKQ